MELYKATKNGRVKMTEEEATQFLADQQAAQSEIKLKTLAKIADKKEKGGVIYQGVEFSTTDRALIKLHNAKLKVDSESAKVFDFVAKDGTVITANAAMINGLYSAVFDYIDAVSRHHAYLMQNIATADINDGWPNKQV